MRALIRSIAVAHPAKAESDERLVIAAQSGDAGAFDSLMKRYDASLRRFVNKRIGTEHVDDVVQDTWIAVWSSLERFSVKAKFRTWIYAIASNKCRDIHRRAKTQELTSEEPDEEPAFARLELQSAVGNALDQLEPAHREMIDLYYFEELTLPEIAKVTGLNLNTVKYRFYRAHQVFGAIMENPNG